MVLSLSPRGLLLHACSSEGELDVRLVWSSLCFWVVCIVFLCVYTSVRVCFNVCVGVLMYTHAWLVRVVGDT